ncbi:MAG: butyrate kinase [Bacteroidales bacterium]|jgi:butyrate kinase|nr:butyrate kinase [Bacteroidales bacterium]
MSCKILAINPGSTSTKIAVFDGEAQLFVKTIKHSTEELSQYSKIADQYEFRKQLILEELKLQGIALENIEVIIGRGGLVKPIPSGVYEINDLMLEHLKIGFSGQHASNLGGLIANSISQSIGIPKSYIADPVVVDELSDLARVSGHPLFERVSIFHALNQKAIARTYAKEHNENYEDLNLVVVHMGGGISVGAHKQGKVIDVNQALDGEGAFSPERSGTLPMNKLVDACFSGKYTLTQMKKMLMGEGGFVAYFGHNDAIKIEKDALAGDPKSILIEGAMAYQVAKEVGAASAVLKGEIDAILLTGGLAYGKPLVEAIKSYISWIAPIFVYPGEDEMKALALNALMVKNNVIEAKIYQ